jgi:hypothetical protein
MPIVLLSLSPSLCAGDDKRHRTRKNRDSDGQQHPPQGKKKGSWLGFRVMPSKEDGTENSLSSSCSSDQLSCTDDDSARLGGNGGSGSSGSSSGGQTMSRLTPRGSTSSAAGENGETDKKGRGFRLSPRELVQVATGSLIGGSSGDAAHKRDGGAEFRSSGGGGGIGSSNGGRKHKSEDGERDPGERARSKSSSQEKEDDKVRCLIKSIPLSSSAWRPWLTSCVLQRHRVVASRTGRRWATR